MAFISASVDETADILGFQLGEEDLEDLKDFSFGDCTVSDLDDTLMQCEIESTTSSNSSQSRKRKAESDFISIASMKKREYYQKKQAVALKWKALLSIPPLISNACNSADADALRILVEKYFTEDCTYETKIKTVTGREEMVNNLLILDEACPDVIVAYKDFRIVNNEVSWTFSFSGTKQFVSASDASFDPLTAPGASKRMYERASIIKSMGRKYVYFGSGTANLIPTENLDRFHTFYISSHRCDVRFSETSDVDVHPTLPSTSRDSISNTSNDTSYALGGEIGIQ